MPGTDIIRFDEKRELFELGLNKVYRDTLKVNPNSYKAWLSEYPAQRYFDTDFAVSGLGVMQEKPVGTASAVDRIYYAKQKTYTIKPYSLALVVQYEVLRWDLYRVFGPVTKELAKSAVVRYDLVAYGLWNNAFSTADSVYTNWNGEAIVSTSHARMDGGTWKNRPTTDIGLSNVALQTATTDLGRTVNHRGQFIGASLKPRLLITATENQWLANTLLLSSTNPDNANQQYNNARHMGLTAHSSPYITTSTYWFLTTGKDDYTIRMGLGDSPDLQSDTEPSTRNRIHTSYCSFRMEVFDSMGIYGSSGA